MAAVVCDVGSLHLVLVGFPDAQRSVGVHQVRMDPGRPRCVDRRTRRQGTDMTELFRIRAAAQQGNQGVMGVHPNIVSPAWKAAVRFPQGRTGLRDNKGNGQLRDRSEPSWEADSISTRETVLQPKCE
jgi:hypothetical protein